MERKLLVSVLAFTAVLAAVTLLEFGLPQIAFLTGVRSLLTIYAAIGFVALFPFLVIQDRITNEHRW